MSTGPVRRRAVAMLPVVAILGLSPLSAQTEVELRGGLGIGSHSASAAGLDFAPAPAWEVLVLRRVSDRLALHGGFVRTSFGCEQGFCQDRDVTARGSHGVVGAELRWGGPWVRLGALLGTVEMGDLGEPSDMGPGLHAGAGLTIGGGRVRFLPGLSYRWLSASEPTGSEHAVALALDLGVSIRLSSGG